MGWASGSTLAGDLIEALARADIDKEKRVAIYKHMLPAFEGTDCDTLSACCGLDEAYDRVLYEMHPDWPRRDYTYHEEDDIDQALGGDTAADRSV